MEHLITIPVINLQWKFSLGGCY